MGTSIHRSNFKKLYCLHSLIFFISLAAFLQEIHCLITFLFGLVNSSNNQIFLPYIKSEVLRTIHTTIFSTTISNIFLCNSIDLSDILLLFLMEKYSSPKFDFLFLISLFHSNSLHFIKQIVGCSASVPSFSRGASFKSLIYFLDQSTGESMECMSMSNFG